MTDDIDLTGNWISGRWVSESEYTSLLIALHDAIRRPMGVVPDSAERFYSSEMSRDAELRRINERSA